MDNPIHILTKLYGVDDITKHRDKTYTARKSFFYTNGQTADNLENNIRAKFPEMKTINKGQIWKPFRGGDSVKKGSHFYVHFSL